MAIVVLISVTCGTVGAVTTIPYSDPRITYLGRWITDGGKYSGWQGAQFTFKVSGTTQVTFNARCVDNDPSYFTAVSVSIDGGDPPIPPAAGSAYLTTHEEVVTADRSVQVLLPNTGEHTLVCKLTAGLPGDQYLTNSNVRLLSIAVDDGATVSAYGLEGPKLLQTVGDSWMAAWHDWPRLMDRSRYSIHPIAYGGAAAENLNQYYPYGASGIPISDPGVDGILISAGVNDYNQGVTTTAFKASLLALLDQVQARQPGKPIFILQAPRNVSASKNYDQYGTVCQQAAAERSSVTYISTSSVWNSLTWLSDTAHLDYASRKKFADFVTQQMNAYFYAAAPSRKAWKKADGTEDTAVIRLPNGTEDTAVIKTNVGGAWL